MSEPANESAPTAAAPAGPAPVGAVGRAAPAQPAAAADATARGAGPAGWAAVALAAVAVLLGWLALQRAGDVDRRLEQERLEDLSRQQQAAEREHGLEDLQRQWNQAQSDADVAGGQMTDPDLRRRREALALIDVERVVEQAQLQLRLGAPSTTAIDALQGADARLGRLAGPGAARVQAALRRDLARLKAAPDLDRGLLAARLDPMLRAVDGWHASADVAHPAERPAPAPVAAPRAGVEAPAPSGWGAQLRAWATREFGDLLRIREIDTPEALRLGPAQQQLLRDRVRLGILDLREAILARDERTIRAEATGLEFLLTRYFDAGQPEVAAAVAQLQATVGAVTGGALPSLDETLAALRVARGAGG
jgi:uroporphyrin-3 C-methyltransferase